MYLLELQNHEYGNSIYLMCDKVAYFPKFGTYVRTYKDKYKVIVKAKAKATYIHM